VMSFPPGTATLILLTLEDRTKHPAVGLAYWNV
jgi:hypothetical protein